MIRTEIEPNPRTVHALGPMLVPVTPNDVIYREVGENPFLRAIGTFSATATTFTVLGSAGNMALNVYRKQPIAFKQSCKKGAMLGLKYGAEFAAVGLIEESLANYRGQTKVYDKVIAGAVVGGAFKIPQGPKQMAIGAAQGAGMAALLVSMQATSEFVFAHN